VREFEFFETAVGKFYTTRGARAALGGVSQGTLARLVLRGEIDARRFGARLLYPPESIARYLTEMPKAEGWGCLRPAEEIDLNAGMLPNAA
jgi:hypothetical protein